MPKQRITKEMVVDAAFALTRADGQEVVTVQRIASALGCSVQPIYSYCHSMDGLRDAVFERTADYVHTYVAKRVDKSDPFRSTGMAWAQLAIDEPHLFSLFVAHRREGVSSLEDVYRMEAGPQMAAQIAAGLSISEEAARALHMHMLVYTIGIGTLMAGSSPGISAQEAADQMERAYSAFIQQTLTHKEGTTNGE